MRHSSIAGISGESFGVTQLVCGSDTFGHENGHNSGVNHDRFVEYDEACETDATTPCFDDRLSTYAYGYVNQLGLNAGAPQERRWMTLMAYPDQCQDAGVFCFELMRFSTPDQSWHGDRLGVPGTHGLSSYRDAADAARRGPANAVRTHNDFAHYLANRMVREAPDLTVKGFRARPSQAAPRAMVHLSAVVENLGISMGSNPDTTVTWCRVSPSRCSTRVGSPAAVPRIESNGRALVSTLFTLPSSRGSYVYRACVSATPGETLTENNCSEDVTVDVGVVDLQLSMSLSTYSARAGAEVTIRGTVRNRGTNDVGFGALVFFGRDAEGKWNQIGWHGFQTLAAGASATFETTFEAPSAAGDYQYATCLRSSHVVWGRNCPVETLKVTGGAPAGMWSVSGVGASIVDLPTRITRIRIEGEYAGYGENFIIWCGGPGDRGGLIVNEILGSSPIASGHRYSGVHSALRRYGGAGEPCRELHIEESLGLRWSITETASGSTVTESFGTGSLAGDVLAVESAIQRARGVDE